MIFSCLKHYFIFFNVNEYLAVPFTDLARGASRGGHLPILFLCKITCVSIPTVTQVQPYSLLEILSSILQILHFDFCMFVWLIKLTCTPQTSHHQDCFRGFHVIQCEPFLFIGDSGFLKNHRSEESRFSVKMEGSPLKGVVYRKKVSTVFHQQCIYRF